MVLLARQAGRETEPDYSALLSHACRALVGRYEAWDFTSGGGAADCRMVAYTGESSSLYLYVGSFNAERPIDNLLYASRRFNGGGSGFVYDLASAGNYVVVVSTELSYQSSAYVLALQDCALVGGERVAAS